MVAGVSRVTADGGGSAEAAGAVDGFQSWQLGSDHSLSTVDDPLSAAVQLEYHVEMAYVMMLSMLHR